MIEFCTKASSGSLVQKSGLAGHIRRHSLKIELSLWFRGLFAHVGQGNEGF